MKRKIIILFIIFTILISITGCGKKSKNITDMVVDEVTDAVYICKNTAGSGEEKEYTIITTGDGKINSVLYSAYIKVASVEDLNKYCDTYKNEQNKYSEKDAYGDVNCDQEKLIVNSKQEWMVEGDINKKYPDYVKKHVNSTGIIDIKGMKEEFTTAGYECNKR